MQHGAVSRVEASQCAPWVCALRDLSYLPRCCCAWSFCVAAAPVMRPAPPHSETHRKSVRFYVPAPPRREAKESTGRVPRGMVQHEHWSYCALQTAAVAHTPSYTFPPSRIGTANGGGRCHAQLSWSLLDLLVVLRGGTNRTGHYFRPQTAPETKSASRPVPPAQRRRGGAAVWPLWNRKVVLASHHGQV